MNIVRELTEQELSHFRDLAGKARSHADKAQEYRRILEGAVSMILDDEQGIDLDRGVVFEDALTEEGE